MTRAVWDASALLVVLLREPGWEAVAPQLETGAVSTVNLAEVATRLLTIGGTKEKTRTVLSELPLEVHDFDSDLAYRAAELREPSRSLGLSLGDRACLALGQKLGAQVVTADRIWNRLDVGIRVVVVRGADEGGNDKDENQK